MSKGPDRVKQFIDDSVAAALRAAAPVPRCDPAVPSRRGPVDIAIPIFKGAEALGACLEALLPTLSADDAVWLLDDGSNDPGVTDTMQRFAALWAATHLVTLPENRGFVATANNAMERTRRDLVLLNSDTEPQAHWLEHLQAGLASNPRAGIACPLSDRATILSVLPLENPAAARLAAETTAGRTALPTAVGFCMLIRRALIEEAGTFSEAFSPGYGEENDFSMRALALGYDVVVADRACVLHHSRGSFGSERARSLQALHQAELNRRWPQYTPLVQSWWRDNPLRALEEHLAATGDSRPVVLHVLHRQYRVGGTERVARTLIRTLSDRYRHILLYPGETDNAWCDFELRSNDPCRELMLNRRWIEPTTRIAGNPADLACAQTERSLARVIRGAGAHIVHFHHFMHWDSLLLPELARSLGCKVVISVHDFWFNCPVHNQLEYATGQPCGRSHAQPDRRCAICLAAHAKASSADGFNSRESAEKYARGRHEILQHVLGNADVILAPSHVIRNKILGAFNLPHPERLTVQPHGVPVPDPAEWRPRRDKTGSVVLGYFGGDQVLKGAHIALQIARDLCDVPVTLKIYGRAKGFDPAQLPPNVELHGFYDADHIDGIMRSIDLALLPSHYEESFSLVLSECWAHGVPVISSNRGALRERVIHGVNGWRVESLDPARWSRMTRQIIEGNAIAGARRRIADMPKVSEIAAADKVAGIYDRLLESAPPRVDSNEGSNVPKHFRRQLRALRTRAIRPEAPWLTDARRASEETKRPRCLGIVRDHWGTAHYRVRFPLEALAASGACEAVNSHVVRDSGFDTRNALATLGATHVMVQPFVTDQGLEMMEDLSRTPGLHVSLVIDDLWTDLPPENPVRATLPPDVLDRLRYLASLSHALVLTTPELRRRLEVTHPHTHVIDNALPARLWQALERNEEKTARARPRVGWAGAPQHGGDLAFLEAVVSATEDLVDWVLLGMCPDSLRDRVSEFHPMCPFDQYPAALARAKLDLAIAPLTDHPFNRCKSHLKVLEYGALGIPVIASDIEPYRACPVTLVPPDDAGAWSQAIRGQIKARSTLRTSGNALRRWVFEHHVLERRVSLWQAALGVVENAV